MGEDERGRSSHEELTKAPNQHYATMMSRSLSARCNVNSDAVGLLIGAWALVFISKCNCERNKA